MAVAVVPVILAITLHEAAHGYAALALGDTTARDAGRLSLNPIRHIDRVGTILLPGFLLISQLLVPPHRVFFMFGWAKPVPIGAWKFKDPRRGMALVASAGPLMNFFLAWLAALVIPLTDFLTPTQDACSSSCCISCCPTSCWACSTCCRFRRWTVAGSPLGCCLWHWHGSGRGWNGRAS